MSWKLAELRWRHDIGLYESRREKEGGGLPVERKKAIQAFERRGREPRSSSASRRVRKSVTAGDLGPSLGELLLPHSTAFRLPIEATTCHTSRPRAIRDRALSSSSLVSLLQSSARPTNQPATSQSAEKHKAAESKQSVTRRHSCSALSRTSSQLPSGISERARPLEIKSCRHVFLFDDSRGHIAAQEPGELEHLMSQRDSGLSSSDLTERLLWQTTSEFSQVIQFADVDESLLCRRKTLDPSVVEAFDNLLEFEGAVFELLNTCDGDRLWDVGSPQDSSETRWASTVSKHQSTSFLIPFGTMAEKTRHKAEMPETSMPSESTFGEGDVGKPRTPKRRMTPIYNDYQTAVSMIRSGTPKPRTPASPSGLDSSSNFFVDVPDIPKTPDRKFSCSMTDIHQKLVENYNDLQLTLPSKDQALAQSVTTPIPSVDETGDSIPVFPLRGRDSDEENERLVARSQSPPMVDADNPAGVEVGSDDIPLREIGVEQVRSRTRGDAVTSYEVRASSADFDHIDHGDSSVPDLQKRATHNPDRASDSGATDTSTIGKIVNKYVSTSCEEVDGSEAISPAAPLNIAPEGYRKIGERAQPAKSQQSRCRFAADVGPVGPPPSWPLPNPPTVPLRTSKRRNSSGILSSPETYGNTGRLLDLSSPERGMSNAVSSAEVSDGLFSLGATQFKTFDSSDDLAFGSDLRSSPHPIDNDNKVNHIRLSHISEKSSAHESSVLGWAGAVGYFGRLPQALNGSDHAPHFEGSGAAVAIGKSGMREVGSEVERSPAQCRANDLHSQPPMSSSGSPKRQYRTDGGVGIQLGSPDQVVAGEVDTDEDTVASADDADWETIHSRSQSNLRTNDGQRVNLVRTQSDEVPSITSLHLGKAPVSAWDPLSNNRAGLGQSEKKLEEMVRSHKESTQNKEVNEVEVACANDSNPPMLPGRAKASFLLPDFGNAAGRKDSDNAADSLPGSFVQPSQAVRSQPHARPHYRHPTPLQPQHEHPFTANRAVLHPFTKAHSISSTYTRADQMYNLHNGNIESTSSGATGSPSVGSFSSRQELEAEIARYDPDRPRVRREFPNARLTVDRRVWEASLDPEAVRVQRQLAWYFRLFSAVFFPFGGFAVMKSMANGGELVGDLMLQVSRGLGLPVVGTLHEEDVKLAEKWEAWCLVFWFLVLCACVAVVAWAIKATMQA